MRLIIKEAGCSLDLPRVGLIRTPCNIEISGVDINLVLSTIKMNGISKYQIIEDDNVSLIQTLPKTTRAIKANKTIIIKEVINDKTNSIELTKLSNKVEQLIDNVYQLLDREIKSNINEHQKIPTNPKVEKLDDNLFVPEINLDDMEIHSNINQTDIDVENDISSSADILRELKGGK